MSRAPVVLYRPLFGFFSFKINFYLFIYFWCPGSSLLHVELSLVAVLLFAVASLVAEHRLQGTWASVVVAYGLSCPVAGEIFLDQGWNPRPLHRFLSLDHQEVPFWLFQWAVLRRKDSRSAAQLAKAGRSCPAWQPTQFVHLIGSGG